MKKVFLALGVLVLGILACGQYVTPTPAPNALGTSTNSITPTSTLTPTPSATLEVVSVSTATILRPVVQVHKSPGGTVTGYVNGGDTVTIVMCVDEWCEIAEPPGWVWRGCLSDNPAGLGCEAK